MKNEEIKKNNGQNCTLSPSFDVIVIGAGPAGLAAALASDKQSAKTLLIEREGKPGGILKQCIHDGFGLVRFGEKLTGPEYAHRFTSQLPESGVTVSLLTYVSKIKKLDQMRSTQIHAEEKENLKIKTPCSSVSSAVNNNFEITLINKEGVSKVNCKSIILACGCRERTSRQIGIHGRHAAGIITAGTAQYYTNILGKLPAKRCVILGSGDIGLIMARRLKLEGADVLGVYEAKSAPSGLMRNVYQCLEDFDIPLFTSKTVTRVFGEGRLNAVEISSVDENMEPVSGTEEIIKCDTLVLSVGLIPENELAESIGIPLDPKTKGPVTDQNYETLASGVFCCGNALHVNDLVDFVSESGDAAGIAAAKKEKREKRKEKNEEKFSAPSAVKIYSDNSLLYVVPQMLRLDKPLNHVVIYFRSGKDMGKTRLSVKLDNTEVFTKTYQSLRPPEMERLEIDFSSLNLNSGSVINFSLEELK